MKKDILEFLRKFKSFKNLIAIFVCVFLFLHPTNTPEMVLIILASYLVGYLPTNYIQKKLFKEKAILLTYWMGGYND